MPAVGGSVACRPGTADAVGERRSATPAQPAGQLIGIPWALEQLFDPGAFIAVVRNGTTVQAGCGMTRRHGW